MYNGNVLYRRLGIDGTKSSLLCYMPCTVTSSALLRHVEGTTHRNGTTPTIGHGNVKLCRDYAMHGCTVGCYPDDPERVPDLIEYNTYHVPA